MKNYLTIAILSLCVFFFLRGCSDVTSNSAKLKASLKVIDKYFTYYNANDFESIKPLMYQGSNPAQNENIMNAIKHSRVVSGKYLEDKYPNNEVKNIDINSIPKEKRFNYNKEIMAKYGEDISEDPACWKNNYTIAKSTKFTVLDICIVRKFQNTETPSSFIIYFVGKKPYIARPVLFR